MWTYCHDKGYTQGWELPQGTMSGCTQEELGGVTKKGLKYPKIQTMVVTFACKKT